MLLYETMTTVKWVNKKFRNILKLLFIKTLEKKTNSCNMYVVRPPSALILADLHNFVLAESFLFYRFQNLTLIKLKRAYLFFLVKLQTFPPFLKGSHQKEVSLIFYHFCLKSHNYVILRHLIIFLF